MIKPLVFLLVLACLPLNAVIVGRTNMVLSVRMQWSTNGSDWNEDGADFVDWDEFELTVSSNKFYTSQITNDWGSFDPYEPMTLDNLWGNSPDAMTNHLLYSTFYVVPNRNQYPNIIYRPLLSLTNYTLLEASIDCTNCSNSTNVLTLP